jgi:Uma2 family endonuclease
MVRRERRPVAEFQQILAFFCHNLFMDAVKTKVSPEAYLEREVVAEFRSEYRDGEVIPMPGGTPNHNRLAGNFYRDFNAQFEDGSYEAFINDMRLWIPTHKLFTYPDVMVIHGETKLLEGRKDTLLDPVLVVEVLSDSTELYDRTDKFQMYRTLKSLKEYVLISQYKLRVDHYAIDAQGQWLFRDYEGENAVLKLASIPFEIKLAQLYRKVNFASETRSELE